MTTDNAAEAATTEKVPATGAQMRVGRPPLKRAGEVEARILEAAGKVFLERGFDGASIDAIAVAARAGKPTIYSRYPNKEALFAAAVAHRIAVKNARLGSHKPSGATIEERLASIGVAIIRETVTEEFIGLFRLAIAEARRFPDLVGSLTRMARTRGTGTVAGLLAEVAECRELGPGAKESPERCQVAARIFTDLILLPWLTRALYGESLQALRLESDAHVAQRVAFFLAACRNGGMAGETETATSASL